MAMILHSGRSGRRYMAVGIFAFVLFVLYHAVGWARGIPAYSSSSEITYVPSSSDWSRTRVYHPVKDLKAPPAGTAKVLPKIQARVKSEAKDDIAESHKAEIKAKFIKSWDAYKKHAWSKDELMPLSGKGRHTLSGWSAQVVDAMDTLWVLGLKDEFRLAVSHVASIDFARPRGNSVDVFEVTIRYLGGIIGAFELSEEPVLLSKAIELGDVLYAAFDTPNRLPVLRLDYADAKNGRQEASPFVFSAAAATLSMEFTRLSQLTGDSKYFDATERIKQFLRRTQSETRIPGLWPRVLNLRDEKADETMFTFGSGADSLYEYLPKMYALLGGLDGEYKNMAVQALDAATDTLLFRPLTPNEDDILMVGNVVSSKEENSHAFEMQHLSCFSGAMYGLAGKLFSRNDFVEIGSRLAAGCVWAYDSFPSNIMPEISELVPCESLKGPCPYPKLTMQQSRHAGLPEGFIRVRDPRYSLRPEAIESVFYMWRITGEKIWREAAWRMWEAITREAETELAFATVEDVTVASGTHVDSMDVSDFPLQPAVLCSPLCASLDAASND